MDQRGCAVDFKDIDDRSGRDDVPGRERAG
jgi:hypothetical protein